MSRQRQDKPDEGKPAYVRLSSDERAELQQLAARGQRSLSGEIRLAIVEHLERVRAAA